MSKSITPLPAPMSAAQKKRVFGPLVKRIERHKAAIARHRDALRELFDDAEAVLQSCQDAEAGLDEAIQSLSQYL